jgi:hypothetical protein
MRSVPKSLKTSAFIFVVVLLLAQAIRTDRSNPSVRADLTAEPDVKSVLRRVCYNCHSNETVWPWYSGLAPVSWLVGNDVKEGRKHLNFSEWGNYDSGTQFHKLRGIEEELQAGEMPPWYYSLAHRDSRLNASEQSLIVSWTAKAAKPETK